ncbi:MAG: alcohol dehydrogenase catalytic domain-containing protein [Xanthomonadales bacterium]|nr:alcohol dehydrogenase catalytic domain-containing protein [Gammaproteobacteria bacterium]NNE06308.1 alcohol dehydrogenase catalytic domain-containing protein [Xanthomonadales bacterium]NNL95987.1 alcohol dehydrogenase catalytic domain-containing protein [Xanthomonadales bacterium]
MKSNTMCALRRDHDGIQCTHVPVPEVSAEEVILEVEIAGICRTDVDVANGAIRLARPTILGHEFGGRVLEAEDLRIGERVAINPILNCGHCTACKANMPRSCAHAAMLGVDRDGAFAERISVPRSAVFPVGQDVPVKHLAYVEPMAATLGVAQLELPGRVGITGSGRITRLCKRVLHALDVDVVPLDGNTAPHSIGVVIECTGMAEGLQLAVDCTEPGGLVVLKSRRPQPAAVNFMPAVRKELRFQGVHYGDFAMAVDWMQQERINIDDLLGPVLPLQDWKTAFEAAEGSKVFLDPRL